MAVAWKQYQEEACSHFLSLGLQAATDVTIQGVRTTHDVDVLVKFTQVGFDVTWLVECKKWKTSVSKLHILALREIVADTGADRGIVLSEVGFQSGAVEASRLTNVQVTSLATLASTSESDIFALRLREMYDRVEACNDRYWDISKEDRIASGLRSDVGDSGYSGARVIDDCREMLSQAFRGRYPIDTKYFMIQFRYTDRRIFSSARDVVQTLEPLIAELESKLTAYHLT